MSAQLDRLSAQFPVIGDALPHRGNAFSTWLAQTTMRLAGWRIEGNFPDVGKLIVIVAPHTTNWDFFVGVAAIFALRLRIRFFIKHTVFRWPAGSVLKWLGGIPIDRTHAHGVVAQAIGDFERHAQILLAITPEGTRKAVKRWHEGFYHIALGAQVPIVPATFDYRERIVFLGPPLFPGGNATAEIARLKAYCVGRRPDHAASVDCRDQPS
jgi:1-acyl-sn-glycerol-3-phosphate acyltransferase